MKPRCFRCEKTKEGGARIAYWIRHKDFNNLFVCRECDKHLKETDPAWAMIEKAWRLLGGWSKDDQKRFDEFNKKKREVYA